MYIVSEECAIESAFMDSSLIVGRFLLSMHPVRWRHWSGPHIKTAQASRSSSFANAVSLCVCVWCVSLLACVSVCVCVCMCACVCICCE